MIILDDTLVFYRKHNRQISAEHRDKQILCDKMVKKKLLTELLGNVSTEEVDFHFYYSTGYYPETKISPKVTRWYKRLLKANSQLGIYNQRKLRRHIERVVRILIRHTFTDEMSVKEKLSLSLHYASLSSVLIMLIACSYDYLVIFVMKNVLSINGIRNSNQ